MAKIILRPQNSLNGMVFGVRFTELCAPGMGVNLWGETAGLWID